MYMCVRVLAEELELQSGCSYLMWILGTKIRSSGRASTSHSELYN